MSRQLLISLIILSLPWLSGCRGDNPQPPLIENLSLDQVKIEVADNGIYRVTLAELQAAGLTLETMSAASLALREGGKLVPFVLQEDALIFHGEAPVSRYSAVRPYVLTTGEAGRIMEEATVTAPETFTLTTIPQRLHLEEDTVYEAQARIDDETDVWFWHEINFQQSVELSFSLATLAEEPATLRMQLWGFTENPLVVDDHDFDLEVNGQTLETVRWDGKVHHHSETAVSAGVLRTGENRVVLNNTIEGATLVDVMQLNWLELEYRAPPTAVNDRLSIPPASGSVRLSGFSGAPLLFDLASPGAPQRLHGWECGSGEACLTLNPEMRLTAVGPAGFLRPEAILPMRASTWSENTDQVDLIVVTTDELAPALTPLVETRQEQGLQVAVVPVAEIYDEFGYGAASPESIRDFVKHAYENWSARYLLLVGDATLDYRNNLGIAPENIVPSLVVPVQYSGETVSDARLADVNDDLIPDLAVGRWPVSTQAEVESLVARTLAYEQGSAARQALFAVDGTEPQFAQMAERLAQAANISSENATLLEGPTYDEVVDQWNSGAWLTTYVGHGSLHRWGKDDVLNLDAIADLETDSPSIVVQLTCLSGLFAHPEQDSLTEEMMRHPQGPVLHVAATSLTLSFHQEIFAEELLHNLQSDEYERIGDAFLTAKSDLDVAENSGLREVVDTFSLFGDPSTVIVRPEA